MAAIGLILALTSWTSSKLADEISKKDQGKGVNFISWAGIPLPDVQPNSINYTSKLNKNLVKDSTKEVYDTNLASLPNAKGYNVPNLKKENMTSDSKGSLYIMDNEYYSNKDEAYNILNNSDTSVLKSDLLNSNGVWTIKGQFGSIVNETKEWGYFSPLKYTQGEFSVSYTSTGILFTCDHKFDYSFTDGINHTISYDTKVSYEYTYGTNDNPPQINLILEGWLKWNWQGGDPGYTGNYYNTMSDIYLFNTVNW